MSGFGFGLDIGVHRLNMESMKKFRIGSGLQNFHICTPLFVTVRERSYGCPVKDELRKQRSLVAEAWSRNREWLKPIFCV